MASLGNQTAISQGASVLVACDPLGRSKSAANTGIRNRSIVLSYRKGL